ncbi:MAG: sigma-70 family RNA polymerase sigma factor [Actinomycetota bacterium]
MSKPVAEFEDFYRAHHRRLASALYLLTGSASEAEDLAQEAMARVYERWPRVSTMASPEGFVYRIAMNLNRSRLRRLAVRMRRAPASPPRADELEAATARLDVHRALQGLTREQREAVILVDWLGLGADGAAPILGVKPATIRTRLHRARPILRERLGRDDD